MKYRRSLSLTWGFPMSAVGALTAAALWFFVIRPTGPMNGFLLNHLTAMATPVPTAATVRWALATP